MKPPRPTPLKPRLMWAHVMDLKGTLRVLEPGEKRLTMRSKHDTIPEYVRVMVAPVQPPPKHPKHLYRVSDGERLTLQKDGQYTFDSSRMARPHRFTHELLMEGYEGDFSPARPRRYKARCGVCRQPFTTPSNPPETICGDCDG